MRQPGALVHLADMTIVPLPAGPAAFSALPWQANMERRIFAADAWSHCVVPSRRFPVLASPHQLSSAVILGLLSRARSVSSACLAWTRSSAVTASRTMASVASQAGDWRPRRETRSGNRRVAVSVNDTSRASSTSTATAAAPPEASSPGSPGPSGHSRGHLARLATAEPVRRSLTAYNN